MSCFAFSLARYDQNLLTERTRYDRRLSTQQFCFDVFIATQAEANGDTLISDYSLAYTEQDHVHAINRADSPYSFRD